MSEPDIYTNWIGVSCTHIDVKDEIAIPNVAKVDSH